MADEVVPDDKARRILERAAEIDRADSMSIANLREAAREAGISEAAFEAAVQEHAQEQNLPARERGGRRWMTRGFAIFSAALLLYLLFALSERLVP